MRCHVPSIINATQSDVKQAGLPQTLFLLVFLIDASFCDRMKLSSSGLESLQSGGIEVSMRRADG